MRMNIGSLPKALLGAFGGGRNKEGRKKREGRGGRGGRQV